MNTRKIKVFRLKVQIEIENEIVFDSLTKHDRDVIEDQFSYNFKTFSKTFKQENLYIPMNQMIHSKIEDYIY
jgi:hypothetical protein